MTKYLLLAIAGALGAIARYAFGGAIHTFLGIGFPYGTLLVNIAGCTCAGFVGTLADEHMLLSPSVRMAIMIGFLGAFTTFSSFTYETWMLARDGELMRASINIAVSIVCCFLGLFIGILTARLL